MSPESRKLGGWHVPEPSSDSIHSFTAFSILDVVSSRPALFRTALNWRIDETQDIVKQQLWLGQTPIQSDLIRALTSLQANLLALGTEDLRILYERWRNVKPSFVNACVQEALEAELALAEAIGLLQGGRQ